MLKSKTNIILLIILISLLSIGGFIGYNLMSPPLEAANYKGMNVSEATSWFKEKDSSDKLVLEYEYSDDVPEGELIFQSLKEGTKITEKITLVYSKGIDPEKQKILIPLENLKDYSTAKSYFDSNGFTNIEYIFEASNKENKTIINIEPLEALKDDHIIVKVAGPKIYEIPSFSTKEEVEAWVKGKNIKIEYSYESSSEAENKIIKVSPSTVSEGESISVVLTSKSNKAVLPTNLLGISEEEFLSKCKSLGLTNVVKDEKGYYSSKTAKGKLAYYMPDGTISKDEKIVYRLSLGKYEFDKNAFNGLKINEAQELIKDLRSRNALINTEIITEEKESANKNVLFNCEGINKDDFIQISCNISTGNSNTSDNTAKIVELPTNLLGKSENEFLAKCKEIGLTNIVKDDKGYYSTLNKAGTIGYYDPDGKINSDQKVVYRLSLGPFVFKAENFNGKAKNDLDSYVKELNDLNAKVTIATTEVESTKENGKAFDCTSTKEGNITKISCKISKNVTNNETSTKAVLPTNLLGKSESEFLEVCKTLGFTNVVKDEVGYYSTINKAGTIAYYDPDGTLEKTAKITYRLSLGSYVFDEKMFNGKTKAEADTIVNNLNNQNAHVSMKTTNTVSDTYSEGTLFSCSASKDGLNTNINCSIAVSKTEEEKKSTILNADKLISYYSTTSFEDTSNKIKKYFADGGFTNVSVSGVSSTKSVGQIISISVGGNPSYSQGEYKVSTPIVIEICNELKN